MPSGDLSARKAGMLWDDIVSIMADGVRDGKIITTRPEHRDAAGPLWPENAYYTYQRQGRSCRLCDAAISLTEVAGRKLYWCPGCQRGPCQPRNRCTRTDGPTGERAPDPMAQPAAGECQLAKARGCALGPCEWHLPWRNPHGAGFGNFRDDKDRVVWRHGFARRGFVVLRFYPLPPTR